MTFKESLQFLEGLVDNERTKRPAYPFDLESYRIFLQSLGSPEKKIVRPVLIAGTKGKGSTATLIATFLQSFGYKVGLYLSPHLIHIRERFTINGDLIPEERFTKFVGLCCRELPPDSKSGFRSVFEILTTIAFLHFLEEEVDYSVLEVGLGGRLDATNIVDPLVSVITSLSLDHTDILGGSLGEIALEKAGIIRENGVVVSAPQRKEALYVLEEVCRERRAELILVGRDLQYEVLERSLKGTRFRVSSYQSPITNHQFFLPLLGDHQVENATVAIGTLSVLGLPITNYQLPITLPLRGRLEIVAEKPWIVLDGAHNPYSAECLVKSIQTLFPHKRVILLCSILSNKDIEGIARTLVPVASEIILTRTNSPRTASLSKLKEIFERCRGGALATCSPKICEDTETAFKMARELVQEEDLILVTGSMYLVGDILKIIQNAK